MIDFVKLELDTPEELQSMLDGSTSFRWNDIAFDAVIYDREIQSYRGKLNNMRIKVYQHRIWIEGSLHKYWFGNNTGAFTFADFQNSICDLEGNLGGIDLSLARIKRVEYGINLKVENAENCYESLLQKGRSNFNAMTVNGRQYGKDCELNQYRIKAYDKCLETKMHIGEQIDGSIFRWEILVKKVQYFATNLKRTITVLDDLCSSEVWLDLGTDLILKYDGTMKQRQDLKGLTEDEVRTVVLMRDKEFRDWLENNNSRSYKYYVGKYKKILGRNVESGDDEMIELMVGEVNGLLDD